MERDSIDLTSTDVKTLFRKMFFPTLLGMLSVVALTIVDGIFVGRGVGSHALAAVNIVAPLFMITTGVDLLFGVGASVVASIHLSHGRIKAANINITQALVVALLVITLMGVTVLTWDTATARLLGASDGLLPDVLEYMHWIVPALILSVITGVGLFVIRLDGSPTVAMLCNIIPAALNIILDYIFVFPLQMGLMGAALATSIALTVGALMVIVYLVRYTKLLQVYRLKISLKSLRLTLRNISYMIKIGSSSMLGEVAIASMMLIGNYMFMKMLQEDGVAAFSVMCYCFPIVFMVANAIAHAAQPILSYNYGIGRDACVRQTFRLSMQVAFVAGALLFAGMYLFCPAIVSLFLAPDCNAYAIATAGIPYFTFGFVFFTLNIAWIGYYQSIEKSKRATFFMVLRGVVLMGICFVTLPLFLGEKGLWLAIPCTEMLVFGLLVGMFLLRRKPRREVSVDEVMQ